MSRSQPDAEAVDRDRELWNPRIHWLLCMCPAELGERSGLAGTVSCIEHGGPAPGNPNTDPYSNYQVGWCAGDSPADRWRKLWPVWQRLSPETQAVFVAHYSLRNDLPAQVRISVDGALGKLAAAALWVHEGEALTKLITACADKGKAGRDAIIKAALRRTEKRVREAHREWETIAEFRPDALPDTLGLKPPPERGADRWEATYATERAAKERVAPVLRQRREAAAARAVGAGVRAFRTRRPRRQPEAPR